jgi:hypothetical protein
MSLAAINSYMQTLRIFYKSFIPSATFKYNTLALLGPTPKTPIPLRLIIKTSLRKVYFLYVVPLDSHLNVIHDSLSSLQFFLGV